ncbi:hypothetical protein [Roseibacillus persicicus]|uniref:Uncharacterized protein n=1 Tax=Roseibacillus persicicus TaxID=454148 RepID=A0A918TTA2_9BACT|nr:hypothetical protein [Roseibacillus persicicus]GHC61546.1 hypothetical protein GCM10007100_31130 [Roseibacillus persicicus]
MVKEILGLVVQLGPFVVAAVWLKLMGPLRARKVFLLLLGLAFVISGGGTYLGARYLGFSGRTRSSSLSADDFLEISPWIAVTGVVLIAIQGLLWLGVFLFRKKES